MTLDATIRNNLSPRALRLLELARWAKGQQYEGRPHWFDDSVPLHERAPCIVYPAAEIAVLSNTDLVLGEGRFPTLTTKPGEDDDASDEDALDENASAALDRLIIEIAKQSRFRAVTRIGFGDGQRVGSCALVQSVRKGRLRTDAFRGELCTPELDDDGCVLALEIRYVYTTETKQRDGSWRKDAWIFRRRIDAIQDVTYLPATADPNGVEPAWEQDPSRSVVHQLGWCPVVWYAFGSVSRSAIDGDAIHALCMDEMYAHDTALSQRHRAARYTGDPQWTETGVEPGTNPSASGRAARIATTPSGGTPSKTNPVVGHFVDAAPGAQGARRKGPGVVWQYESPDTKAQLHALPGDALDSIDKDARDLKTKLQEMLGVVLLDPENIKFAATTSGKALETIKQRQIDRCDTYRDDVGDKLLLPVMQQFLRLCAQLGDAVKVRGRARADAVLKQFLTTAPAQLQADAGPTPFEWEGPTLTLRWPPYFKPDATEDRQLVDTATAALKAGMITMRVAVEKVARTFGIEQIDAHLRALEEEREANAKRQADLMHAMTNGEDDDSDEAGAGGDTPQAPGGGAGAASGVAASDAAQTRDSE